MRYLRLSTLRGQLKIAIHRRPCARFTLRHLQRLFYMLLSLVMTVMLGPSFRRVMGNSRLSALLVIEC
jgi:hypothetical protein